LPSSAPDAGITTIPLPTGFAVGPMNAYLIEDDPLTLIDAGPNSGTALDALERGLAARGHRLEDLERIVVTHQHMDHLGLVQLVADRADAEILAFAPLQPGLADWDAFSAADDEFSVALMTRHGVSEEVRKGLKSMSRVMRAFGGPVRITRGLVDGDEIGFAGRTLTVHHRHGHSPSDLVFHDAASGLLIAGDHLIKHISSNPLATRALDGSPERPPALKHYLASMERTREMDVSLVLAGHGEQFTDHVGVIDERFRGHRRREEKLAGLIEAQPSTAHELAHELWGRVAVTQAYLTLSEVLGHTDLLIDEGRVVEDVDAEGVVRFVATG
jgi:glyoxylase-like metal-dependent hydrolase (beta-lactamase superfamily II)